MYALVDGGVARDARRLVPASKALPPLGAKRPVEELLAEFLRRRIPDTDVSSECWCRFVELARQSVRIRPFHLAPLPRFCIILSLPLGPLKGSSLRRKSLGSLGVDKVSSDGCVTSDSASRRIGGGRILVVDLVLLLRIGDGDPSEPHIMPVAILTDLDTASPDIIHFPLPHNHSKTS